MYFLQDTPSIILAYECLETRSAVEALKCSRSHSHVLDRQNDCRGNYEITNQSFIYDSFSLIVYVWGISV